jgi:ribosomal protein S12 methylthiotransferase accessory factor
LLKLGNALACLREGRSVFVVNLDGLGNEHGSSILHIVKTFVTGLVPMSFGYLEEPLGMQRIYEVPITLNFHSNPLRYDELNVFPHPYT